MPSNSNNSFFNGELGRDYLTVPSILTITQEELDRQRIAHENYQQVLREFSSHYSHQIILGGSLGWTYAEPVKLKMKNNKPKWF